MKRLTAVKAREIAENNSVDGIITEILKRVHEKAEEGKISLHVRSHGFGDSNLYAGDLPIKQKEVIDELTQLGYKVNMKFEEKQFVDIYLLVSW